MKSFLKKTIIHFIGSAFKLFMRIYYRYEQEKMYSSLGRVGRGVNVAYPFDVQGAENIVLDDNVNIRANAVLTALNAKIVIKKCTAVAPYLYISTGNHMMIPGRFGMTITNEEKCEGYDADVIINEDVWIASRVTILKGVVIGRGAIIAAGAVVNRDVPPYSLCAGVPARFVKFKWNIDTIIEHEQKLYSQNERYSREMLEQIRDKYED